MYIYAILNKVSKAGLSKRMTLWQVRKEALPGKRDDRYKG